MAAKWYVYKQTLSSVCKAQLETERPHLGIQHLGPFDLEIEAIQAMCDDLDGFMTDPSHCWAVLPDNASSLVVAKEETSEAFAGALTFTEIRQKVASNNNSPFSDELIIAMCWAESSFRPDSVAPSPSTSKGLMMVNNGAIDTVNNNTPAGVHFTSADMLIADKSIACGTWYLNILFTKPDWHVQGDKRKTIGVYRGREDYIYADKVIACEGCLQSTVIVNPQTCLNQIHTFTLA